MPNTPPTIAAATPLEGSCRGPTPHSRPPPQPVASQPILGEQAAMITEDCPAPQWPSGFPRGLNLSAAHLRAMGQNDLTTLEGVAFAGGVTGRTRSGNNRPIQ